MGNQFCGACTKEYLIAENQNISFVNQLSSYRCIHCGAPKSGFSPPTSAQEPAEPTTPILQSPHQGLQTIDASAARGVAHDQDMLRRLDAIVSTDTLLPLETPKHTVVTPSIFLGNRYDAANPVGLGITHVLNCSDDDFGLVQGGVYWNDDGVQTLEQELTVVPWRGGQLPRHGKEVCYERLDGQDVEGYDMMQHYRLAEAFIDSALSIGGRVLVHCRQGKNRSALMTIAYLLSHRELWDSGSQHHSPVEAALKHVFDKRSFVMSNASFREQLLVFSNDPSKC